jgi:preprotein translocase subunit Sec63
MFHSLTFLGLGLGASEIEIKVHYQQLACKYPPDKHNPAVTGLTAAEASDFIKLLNNTQEYLKEWAYYLSLLPLSTNLPCQNKLALPPFLKKGQEREPN